MKDVVNVRAPPAHRRRRFLGGSDARIIMGTDEAALLRLWQEKRGEVEPEDFSSNLVVQLGVATGMIAGIKSPLDLLSQPRRKPGKKPDTGEKDQPPA